MIWCGIFWGTLFYYYLFQLIAQGQGGRCLSRLFNSVHRIFANHNGKSTLWRPVKYHPHRAGRSRTHCHIWVKETGALIKCPRVCFQESHHVLWEALSSDLSLKKFVLLVLWLPEGKTLWVNNMKEAFKRVVLVLYFSITDCLQADVWICYVGDFSPWSSSSVERCSFCMELMWTQ